MIKASERLPAPDRQLTLNDVADRLGVHYMTAYKYVRTGKLPATKVGGGWQVSEGDLTAFTSRPATTASGERVDWSARLGDRLIAGDEPGSWSVIEAAMASGIEPASIYVDVLAPALAAIGAAWAIGEVTIAEEHRATTVTNRLIGRLGPRFHRPGRTRGTIVIGAVAGDQHAVPIAIAADLLRGNGFSVIDLGANCPVESFLDAGTSADRLLAIGISASASGVDDAIIATADAVTEQIGCPIVIGGSGIGSRAHQAHASAITSSANEMLAAFDNIAESAASR
jgi:excisionase family DNA binding protein